MRLQLTLLLLCAAHLAVDANSGDMALTDMSLKRTMLAAECPISFCSSGRNCVYSSRTKRWRCTACSGIRIPNAARSECVCPAGTFPTSDGGCSQCKANMYCPQGQAALRSTARNCPANMVTLRRGAKNINECFNAPGYSYRKTSDGVKAVACGVNTWTTGLKKQTTCTACVTGFKTDPETVPGTQTNSDVCQAPAGSFVTGGAVTLCPKGEYSDDYNLATACKSCEELYSGPGITTAREGSTSADNCTWLEPGYALQDDKKRTILGSWDPIDTPISGAKKCPQNYYCPGGDPNGAGKPTQCPHGMWTEDEGASSEDECVAPPGMYLPDGELTANDKMIRHCPQGTYKETWQRVGIAGCLSCGAGDWLSDRTIFLSDLDANTGLVRQQIGVRGSSDSCYIQRGMGAVQERNQATGAVVLRAIACPANYYGVVGVNATTDGVFKKYGKVATPCTQCPTNMITAGAAGKVTSIKVPAADGLALTTSYTQGASQLCADGFWSAGGHKLPCTQCPFGTTTDFTNPINSDAGQLHQYQPPQQDKGTACTSCPASLTTADVGGPSLEACNLCAAGYGFIAQNTTCMPCQDGYFGTTDRKDNRCTKCPGGRTFSFEYIGENDVFDPQTTSKPFSNSQADCVADFSQTVEGASYLDLQPGTGYTTIAGRENLQSCVQECRDNAACTAATFDYATLQCWNWNPDSQESFVANGGVAFKLMSSTNLAASVKAKEMGSGEYNFIPDGVNTPARISPASRSTAIATTSLKACLKACSDVNLCSGVVFGQFSGEDTIPAGSCKLIMAMSTPGSSLRTLIKANFMGLNTDMKVSKGYYSQPATTTVEICPPSDEGEAGYFCPGGPAPGSAPRELCAAANPAGTYMPTGTESADDCGAWLKAGWFYDGQAVQPCLADHFCPGGENYFGANGFVGVYSCPVGTKSAASSDSMEDCNALYDGFFYQAPGNISSTTIKSCDEGYWCNTEDVAIVVDTTTPAVALGGRNPCPVGSSSTAGIYPAAGPFRETHCTRLLAGYEYAGGADISASTVNTCGADRFCMGERVMDNAGASVLGTPCVEGTGVAKKADDDVAGASSANDCLKLYEGYYYTGVGTAISRTTVLPCPANNFCMGYPNMVKNIVRGAPSLPTSCPAGTKVLVGAAYADDAAFFAANSAARISTANSNSAAVDGGRNTNDCDTLRAGYYYTGSAGNSLADPGRHPCPAGVNSLVGSDDINDCNILEPGWYYTGPANTPISDSSVVTCPVNPGGKTVNTATSDRAGDIACAAGSTSVSGSDSSSDCTDLLAGFFYTGAGAISDDTVVACPEDFFCDGAHTIAVATNSVPQGRTACPVGSGSAASSDSRDDCLKVYKGYYFATDGTCASGIQASGDCSYKLCDSPTATAFCPGGNVAAGVFNADVGRTACTFGTRTTCVVTTPGQDCTKMEDCISP
ncbi:hypothetical protein COO60DRAFT_1674488 [Scenedesmus sp. NREL 46B-D3]|nr:hypothetical protein COO60DRAFT_1674488 [Scenedesmus sp. NREL 46B-D3]